MKKNIHPENYRLVAFKDMSNDVVFITRSCANTKETIEIEGVEYPVVKLEISSASHPFYTGKMKLVDTAGPVDKFYQRYANKKKYFFPHPKQQRLATGVSLCFCIPTPSMELSGHSVSSPLDFSIHFLYKKSINSFEFSLKMIFYL